MYIVSYKAQNAAKGPPNPVDNVERKIESIIKGRHVHSVQKQQELLATKRKPLPLKRNSIKAHNHIIIDL